MEARTIRRDRIVRNEESDVVGLLSPPVARLETSIDRMQNDIRGIKVDFHSHGETTQKDFRPVIGSIIAVGLGLTGLAIYAIYWL